MKYRFKDEAEAVSVQIYDEISSDDWWGDVVSSKMINDKIAEANGKPLNIYINSYGGEVFEGFAIYNSLKNYSGYKTVYVDGIAASIASVIAMAGNKIYMNKASMLMIHNASGIAYGNAEEMKKVVNALEQINEVIRGVYKDRTSLSDEELKNLMDSETYFTPQEAVDYGFADEIVDKEVNEESTKEALDNLYESLENRVNQIKEVKAILKKELEVVQDSVSVADEKTFNKKHKFDWLRNGGMF